MKITIAHSSASVGHYCTTAVDTAAPRGLQTRAALDAVAGFAKVVRERGTPRPPRQGIGAVYAIRIEEDGQPVWIGRYRGTALPPAVATLVKAVQAADARGSEGPPAPGREIA